VAPALHWQHSAALRCPSHPHQLLCVLWPPGGYWELGLAQPGSSSSSSTLSFWWMLPCSQKQLQGSTVWGPQLTTTYTATEACHAEHYSDRQKTHPPSQVSREAHSVIYSVMQRTSTAGCQALHSSGSTRGDSTNRSSSQPYAQQQKHAMQRTTHRHRYTLN
jgi:hypothetical protein